MAARNPRRVRPVLALALLLIVAACGPSASSGSDAVPADADAGDAQVSDVTFQKVYCQTDDECRDAIKADTCGTVICQLPAGVCVLTAGPDAVPCDDGDACTVADACAAGRCSGAPRACADANPCTTDTCDAATGCVHGPVDGGACDDANPCTPASTCVQGACQASQNECTCADDLDCELFDDGDRCTGVLVCATGACVLAAGSIVTCDASLDTACARNTCDPAVGACFRQHLALGAPCDDGDACTADDACVNGLCRGVAPLDCDDDNPCTSDFCDSTKGCSYVYSTLPCDDGDRCTVGDRCDFGQCVAGARYCECSTDAECDAIAGKGPCLGTYTCGPDDLCYLVPDSVTLCPEAPPGSCTANVCDAANGGCAQVARADGTPCDDGDVCTRNDACELGACVGQAPVLCGDGDACTADGCQHPYGCVFDAEDANLAPCNDGNFCTGGESCLHGQCLGAASACECFADADCGAHEDGNPCNGRLVCSNQQCVVDPATIVVCTTTSDNPCVDVACNPSTGTCEAVLADEGAACDDRDACTTHDRCVNGTCSAGDPVECVSTNPCRQGYCNAKAGCVFTFKSGPCSDGDPCTAGDICSGGVCLGSRQVNCEDGDPCTADACTKNEGCTHEPLGAFCDDGLACSAFDVCHSGRCVGGPALACDDDNPCTADACSESGGCSHLDLTAACDDGNGCTAGDTCANGACVSGAPCVVDSALDCALPPYDDGNPCNGRLKLDTGAGTCVPDPSTVPSCTPTGSEPVCLTTACDPADGACRLLPAPDDTPCDDVDLCTANDRCVQGACTGEPVNCEDGDVCTDDACDPESGCSHAANAAVCDDDDFCSVFDYCFEGACVSGPRLCDCTDDLDCEVVDDGDRCNGGFVCRDFACVFDDASVVSCDTSGDTLCLRTSCQAASGLCALLPVPDGRRCDDGDACTVDDTCVNGQCQGTAGACDDANPCTADGCDPGTGCTHVVLAAATCDDANPCTGPDFCQAGACVGAWKSCDDGNACTADSCDVATAGGDPCRHQARTVGTPCTDGSACTVGDTCTADAACQGQALDCDDANPCTTDGCDPDTGCTLAPKADATDCTAFFGAACVTRAECRDGKCLPVVPTTCDDANPCTADTCDPTTGACSHVKAAVNAPCPVVGACFSGGRCNLDGVCKGVPLDCGPSSNPCRSRACDPADGACKETALADGLPCTLDQPCTDGGACAAGACVPKPRACPPPDDAACQDSFCDPDLDACTVNERVAACDDGDPCTVSDACVAGACAPGAPRACASANPCVVAVCNPATGACEGQALSDGQACDDANPCTAQTACQAGACVGAWQRCDDGLLCTNDFCDPSLTGSDPCRHEPVDAACEGPSTCFVGACDPTAVGADPISGCVLAQLPLGTGCDDASACTLDDACTKQGDCQGAPISCDDGNPCTLDSCAAATGCAHVPAERATPCEASDGLACVRGDTCQPDGTCLEGSYDECASAVGDAGCLGAPNGTPCDDTRPDTAGDLCLFEACHGFVRSVSTEASVFTGASSRSGEPLVHFSAATSVGEMPGGAQVAGDVASGDLAFSTEVGSARGVRYLGLADRLLIGEGRALTFRDPSGQFLPVEDQLLEATVTSVTGWSGALGLEDPDRSITHVLLAGHSGATLQPWSRRCSSEFLSATSLTSWSCTPLPLDLTGFAGYTEAHVKLGPLSAQLSGVDVAGAVTAWPARLAGSYNFGDQRATLFFAYDHAAATWRLESALEVPVGQVPPVIEALRLGSRPTTDGRAEVALAAGSFASAFFFDGGAWSPVTTWPAGFPQAGAESLVTFRAIALSPQSPSGGDGMAALFGEVSRRRPADPTTEDAKEVFAITWHLAFDEATGRFALTQPHRHLVSFPSAEACRLTTGQSAETDERLESFDELNGPSGEVRAVLSGTTRTSNAGQCLPKARAVAWWMFFTPTLP